MAKPLKRGKKPPTSKTPVCFVRLGSGNTLSEPKGFLTEGAARNAMTAHFESWKAWCQRSNKAMLPNLSAAIDEIPGLSINSTWKRVEAMLDDYSVPPMILVAEVRKA